MSRSYRKTPIIPVTTADSEKLFKQTSNRILRRRQEALLRSIDPDALTLPLRSREVVESYNGPKDGKRLLDLSHPAERRCLRK